MSFAGVEFLKSLPPWNHKGGFSTNAVARVADLLGNPQDSIKTIHVAGTNGKGSVCAFISSILAVSGYKVGLTTSPHLARMNERIIVDGVSISDEILNDTAVRLAALLKKHSLSLSFFEAITILFFLICYERRIDFAVVEVGLGGRLDATNIIKRPEACAIVSIDLDHQDILGDSISAIAREKAGIIKKHVPVFVGELGPEALQEVELIAVEQDARVLALGREFVLEGSAERTVVISSKTNSAFTANLAPKIPGQHQLANAAVAAALSTSLGIRTEDIEKGIRQAFWPGRLERVDYKGRRLLLDAGHNPAGINTLISFIKTQENQKVDVVFGAIGTKNWQAMVDLLVPVARSWSLLRPQSDAAVPCKVIAKYLSRIGVSAANFEDQYDRLLEAISSENDDAPLGNVPSGEKPTVVMAGSIYLLGALRSRMGLPEQPLWHCP